MPGHGILEHGNFAFFSREGYPETLPQVLTVRTLESMLWNPNHLQLSYNLLQENILRRLKIICRNFYSKNGLT